MHCDCHVSSIRLVAVMSFAVAGVALGQSSVQLSLERLSLEPGSAWSSTVNSGDGLRGGHFVVSVLSHFEYEPLRLRVDAQTVGSVVTWRESAHVAFAWGVFDGLEVGAQVPFFVQHGDALGQFDVAPIAGAGVGMPVVRVRSTLLREDTGAPFDLGLSAAVGVPLGTVAALGRDPASGVTFAPRLGLGKRLSLLRVGAELGGEVREGPRLLDWSTQVAPASSLTGALTAATTTLPVQLGVDVRVTTAPVSSHWVVGAEVLGRLRVPLGQTGLSLDAFGGPGFGRLVGTPAFRAAVGLAWAPVFAPRAEASAEAPALRPRPVVALRDFDRDAVPDEDDLCPSFAGLERYSGCPFDGDALLAARADLADYLHQQVHFEFDSARLALDQDALSEAIALIEGVPESGVITIEGHTDAVGTVDYNQQLSVRRAESVRAALVARGVAPERLRVVGRGKAVPEAPNGDPEGRARNRRVRFIVEAQSLPEVARAR
jgi:outer membrane protein OmpA-like peptidoglycan-associated protein